MGHICTSKQRTHTIKLSKHAKQESHPRRSTNEAVQTTHAMRGEENERVGSKVQS